MNVKALEIRIGGQRVGVLFQYSQEGGQVINRFVADEAFIAMAAPPVVSTSFLANSPEEQELAWRDLASVPLNGKLSSDGTSWLLPSFFQNLLPEGVFRDHVAQLRHCASDDHFELLAACGKDLPGNVHALPISLSRDELTHYITQNADALEMTVTADPLEEGVSLSGVQPKLGVIKDGERYVGRTKDHDTHIIAKLPVAGTALLPEVEDLSLRLAAAAGVNVCQAYLEPLSKLAAQHHYDLSGTDGKPLDVARSHFLAVVRYDRSPAGRVHCEDFAQVLGVMPQNKYTKAYSYTAIAAVMMAEPSLGESAVHELLRRLVANEMLGNLDMHLKNIGLWYPDGRTPELPPAYDIVAHVVYHNATRGHGLRILPDDEDLALPKDKSSRAPDAVRQLAHRPALTPVVLRRFCDLVGILERPAAKVISDCVRAAVDKWPEMIAASLLTENQKSRLLAHFYAHPMVESVRKRQHKT
ncbi:MULTISPECIES: type II toxin-antitoxin system HipA family toxin [unclassified Achromobacter]|uniref:type II toxin-antitoxin system HipA family toxin n=1 Tax=unclassified Achromobacter TaxID=2626865 RepID=UPI000B51C98C|nr:MULTISPECIES: type II toxin-antitoxin system HipA family toxin [unclassified Achromobacter]OWT71474.1 phosphatidylinositol kinase [Achromobacter sp. HZ34]OWT73131.1 phosphatidylinositol kinase [Achromobacter sp. HZ28]